MPCVPRIYICGRRDAPPSAQGLTISNRTRSRRIDRLASGSARPRRTAPEFTGIAGWINTAAPISLARLQGKVALVLLDLFLHQLPPHHALSETLRLRQSGLSVHRHPDPKFPARMWRLTYGKPPSPTWWARAPISRPGTHGQRGRGQGLRPGPRGPGRTGVRGGRSRT